MDELEGPYDLIVSNPPYISRDDVEEVGANVLASEPHLALLRIVMDMPSTKRLPNQAPSVLTPDGKKIMANWLRI